MSRRNSIFVLVGALVGCLLLTVCAVGIIGGFVYFNTKGNPLAALSAPAAVNQIAFVGNDFNIYVTDPAGGTKTALTQDGGSNHAYNYPTWSPDNHRLAFVGYTLQANGTPQDGGLYTVAPTGQNLTPIFKTTQNFPFYLYWSPDSQVIGFLANKDSSQIALNIAHSDQPNSNQELDSGSPFYWAWAPDGSQMFTHVGGTRSDSGDARLALLAAQVKNSPQPLPAAPGEFQAPQWSRDGKILFSTLDNSQQIIELSDASGANLVKLASYTGRASFALSPDASAVAYLLTDAQTQLVNFGPLRIVDNKGANMQVVSAQPSLAFQWSPDSTKLAYLSVDLTNNQSNFNLTAPPPAIASTAPEKFPATVNTDQGGNTQILLHWNIWDRTTGTSRVIATFVPTLSFLNIIPYFDQYANSTTFWSPDSKSFVYTANESSNGVVYIADAGGTNSPRKIAEGVIAFWSWK